ncbi:MAG: ABC transporter permease [Firmicutes bacterium]|jgi:peptide/nickel transport system permease protein|nr:ABC transporter permease [Bacillota bacterium]
MTRYIARRLLAMIPLLLGISFIVFSLLNILPGDPVSIMLSSNPHITPDAETIAQLRAQYGLDQPLMTQYLIFLRNLLKGDLGTSMYTQQPVAVTILERMPATIQLALAALVISTAVAIPLGVISAVKQYSWIDHLCLVGSLVGISMPSFWLGLLLMLTFSLRLRWLPLSGMGYLHNGLGDVLRHLIMPACTLGFGMAALLARVTRSSMLEVLGQDYIRTARAKGLHDKLVVYRHALRNAFIPILTVSGMQFGYLLGGSVIIETIFSWPGIGRLAVNSIMNRDLAVVQGTVLVFTLIFILINLLVDILYAAIDPRIQYD